MIADIAVCRLAMPMMAMPQGLVAITVVVSWASRGPGHDEPEAAGAAH